MPTRLSVVAVLWLALLPATSRAADDAAAAPPDVGVDARAKDNAGAKEDLAKVQGIWASEVRDRQGKLVGRVVKYIKGNKEMVVQERADGQLTGSHRVEFEVSRVEGIRLYRFFNGEVTDGAQKGQKMGPYTYVYRVDDDTFTEVFGFSVGEEKRAPVLHIYKRIKDADAPAQPAPPSDKQ
jgi:hypothetical protein